MTFQQFVLMLKARWKLAALISIAVITLVTLVSFLLPKKYTATASVVIDVKSPDLFTGMTTSAMLSGAVLATQIDIIRSPRVAREVVQTLGLDKNPDAINMWRDSTDGKGVLADWLADNISRDLEVLPSRESTVVNITYTAASPEFAAAVANAFAQSYAKVNLGMRVAPARQYAEFFEQQGAVARQRLERAQKELSDYQKASGITSVDNRLDVEMAKLNDISAQLTALQAMSTEARSKRGASRQEVLAEVMQSPLVQTIKADISRLEGKIGESSVIYGAAHPITQSQQAELNTLRTKLEAEVRRVSSSVAATDDINRQREAQLQAALVAQKERVLRINQNRDQLNVLVRNVDSAQRAYDLLLARADQTGVESQVNQTNVSFLNPASPPAMHSKPRVLLNFLVSVVLGLTLGIGIAFIVELIRRKVRCVQDVEDVLEVPFLGQVASAQKLLTVTGNSLTSQPLKITA